MDHNSNLQEFNSRTLSNISQYTGSSSRFSSSKKFEASVRVGSLLQTVYLVVRSIKVADILVKQNKVLTISQLAAFPLTVINDWRYRIVLASSEKGLKTHF